MKKKTTEQFISEAKEVHGNRYNYTLSDYQGCKKKVKILCEVHGVFEQSPGHHISRGQGCNLCGASTSAEKRSKPQEIWITEAKKVHGSLFDYKLVKYTKSSDKVTIICRTHGKFKQQAGSHLQGIGCNKCKYEAHSTNQGLPFAEFDKAASLAHDNKYKYLECTYYSLKGKVGILCKEHGVFYQQGNNHVHNKTTCPSCTLPTKAIFFKKKFIDCDTEKLRKVEKDLYLLEAKIKPGRTVHKIGISGYVEKRVKDLIRSSGFQWEILSTFRSDGYTVACLEVELQERLQGSSATFVEKFSGHTECFYLQDEDLTYIIKEFNGLRR